ncbi:hypothetical protein BIV60_27670 [Bacillus sp. MUM 116]|uniref:hypothetical protein n=1 Tax=Bacillus sp. MUM 116 TaxID=1678002 RepID=UPI0008F5AEC0|nr:hypothetical protein [Bacillus sp. MUM 116]OIK05549.1 hypothetical protein BIV60_27670 [Bacillus sp. MUM 116]
MKDSVETVYILENPEKKITRFATGSQIRYDDVIKEVYGVASIQDLSMMIQFNKGFHDSICEKYEIKGNKISIDILVRIASKSELLQFKKQLVEKSREDVNFTSEQVVAILQPFNDTIRLQEGIFEWNDNDFSYDLKTIA